MILDPAIAVAEDLFVFRCTVSISLYEPRDTGSGTVEAVVRTYGVTAESYAQAAGLVEELAGRDVGEDGEPVGRVAGWLDEVEISLMDPDDVRAEVATRDAMRRPGVHFASPVLGVDEEGEPIELCSP